MDDLTRDVLIGGMTAFEEARGEGQDGIRAQAHSMVNRHKAGRWYSKKTLAATCLLKYAYSCWNTDDASGTIAAETPMDDFLMNLCVAEVTAAIQGTTQDPTGGATHYYVAGSPVPDWVSGIDHRTGKQVAPPAIYLKRIGKHIFYTGVQ